MTPAALHAAVAETWPAARVWRVGPFALRDGQGGGSRVSAATAEGAWDLADIGAAEAAMTRAGQRALFLLREGEDPLDAELARRGYSVMDPVVGYVAPITTLTAFRPPPVTTFEVWPALAAQAEIWAEGGVGPARLAVMDRATGPKVSILGRLDDRPAGTAFVALGGGPAMVHAVQVRPAFRRRGLGGHMLRAAAFWAGRQGASDIGLVVTVANAAARALYEGLGMTVAARYHYRVLPA